MKFIILLDTHEYIEVAPEKLELRQLQPAMAVLGTQIEVPVRDAEGKLVYEEVNPPGTVVKTQIAFLPLVNYPVVLTPAPAPGTDPEPETVAIHRGGKTTVTDSNSPDAQVLATRGRKATK